MRLRRLLLIIGAACLYGLALFANYPGATHDSVLASRQPAPRMELASRSATSQRTPTSHAAPSQAHRRHDQSCNATSVQNPVFTLREGRVRDPAVLPLGDGSFELYFTHYRGRNVKRMWGGMEAARAYTVRVVTTSDWVRFSAAEDVTPAGFVSPDSPVAFGGGVLLAFQAYPE